MSSERVNYLSEMYLLGTRLIWGELSHADPVISEEISGDEQNDRDFFAFESAIPAISGAYESIDMKSENSDMKFQKTLEEQLSTFGTRLANLDKTNEHASASSGSNYGDSIDRIYLYGESILTTGSCDREIQKNLLPQSATQWKEGVAGLTEANKMAEMKAYTKHFERLGKKPSKSFESLMNTECIDLPLDNLFDDLVNGTCRNQDHEALLYLSGWKDIEDKSVFHTRDVKSHDGSLSICKEIEDAQRMRIPLWLSFNSTNIWLADTKGLEIISHAKKENRRQITMEQLIQQKRFKSSDIHIELKKFHLAFRLVSSLRHLYLGSWLQQDLTLRNIFVMHDSKADSDNIMIEPYLNCQLQDIPKDMNDVIKDFDSGSQDYSRFFLSLAQVLIDIFKGGMGQCDYGTKLTPWCDALAEEAEMILQDDLSKHYRAAVYSCLLFLRHYHVGMGKAKTRELRAQWVILEHIVAPLRRNLDIWEAQVSQLSKVYTNNTGKEPMQCETCQQPYHRDAAHKAAIHRPTLAAFTLFSDEDDRNQVLKSNRFQVRSEHDFSTRMGRFVQRHILRAAGVDIPTDYPHKRVKVAIIDTGFCANDDLFFINAERRIRNCRSFIGKETDWEDIHGHGTHVARLVLRHAPECEVYVAKISDTRSFSEDQVGQLAKALEWAGEQADIINLSFGLGQLCPSPRLKEVLDKLVLSRKLIFAAASNSGGNRSRPWPANDLGVFCIHVTNERAVPNLNMNPIAKSSTDNFATLGENIQSYWMGEERCISGTSFATPIAAAMAANILEFACRNLSADESNALQAYRPIRRLFRNQITDNGEINGAYHCIKPWSDQLWGGEANNADVARVFREFLVHWT
ncbi:Minor extracellular protease Epr [Fusarium oxysporum f. sp. raphani]|nr:Minor extracellular protease Epr [Fusarium oxysporum f. sp. raphani]